MDIRTYREKHGLSQADFAALFPNEPGKSATQGLVWQWEDGKQRFTAERAIQIEQITGGEVTRHELRPDLFAPQRAA